MLVVWSWRVIQYRTITPNVRWREVHSGNCVNHTAYIQGFHSASALLMCLWVGEISC